MIAFPIPVPPGTPPIIGILFGIAAIVGFAVLIWQAVRYFRSDRDADDRDADDRDADDRDGR
jgi:threonine/homoserine/homoserine lactone efflux protein